jgi:hypothetical protein
MCRAPLPLLVAVVVVGLVWVCVLGGVGWRGLSHASPARGQSKRSARAVLSRAKNPTLTNFLTQLHIPVLVHPSAMPPQVSHHIPLPCASRDRQRKLSVMHRPPRREEGAPCPRPHIRPILHQKPDHVQIAVNDGDV